MGCRRLSLKNVILRTNQLSNKLGACQAHDIAVNIRSGPSQEDEIVAQLSDKHQSSSLDMWWKSHGIGLKPKKA